jgi:hypothetical protein
MTTGELLHEAKLTPKKAKEESRKKVKCCTWIAMSGFRFTAELNGTRRNEWEFKKQCLMVRRNVRPKKPNGKENGESGAKSKGKERDVEREKSRSKSQERKLNKSRNGKLKAKAKVVKSCIIVSLKVESKSKSC